MLSKIKGRSFFPDHVTSSGKKSRPYLLSITKAHIFLVVRKTGKLPYFWYQQQWISKDVTKVTLLLLSLPRRWDIPEEELRPLRRVPGCADPQQVLPLHWCQWQPHQDGRESPSWRQGVRPVEELDAEGGSESRHQCTAPGPSQPGPEALRWEHRLSCHQEGLLQTRRHALTPPAHWGRCLGDACGLRLN